MQLGLEQILVDGGYGAYSTHFGADRGGRPLRPAAARRSVEPDGEGLRLQRRGRRADRGADVRRPQNLIGETQFTEMYAMDFARDAFLMSHMGEGNWALARDDEPVKLIKRPLGIGGLDDPPTFLFQYRVGAGDARRRSSPSGDERFRLVVSEGEILDTDELPGLEMPYGFFRPDGGSGRVRRTRGSARRPAPPGPDRRPHGGGVAPVLRGRRDRADTGLLGARPAHVVADLHASGSGDGGVDTEGQRLGATLAPVEGEGPERVEVGDAAIGVV